MLFEPAQVSCVVTGIASAIVAIINGLLFSFPEERQQKLELGRSGMAIFRESSESRVRDSS